MAGSFEHPLSENNEPPIARIIGEGWSGIVVVVDTDPGYCYKIPTDIRPEQAQLRLGQQKSIHTVLQTLQVPTLPEFDAQEFRPDPAQPPKYCVRMTDLSEGGRNLVSSPSDKLRIERQFGDAGLALLYGATSSRPVYNADAFFGQLKDIVHKTIDAQGVIAGVPVNGIRIASAGYFLVAHPSGTIETRIGDLDDGVELRANNIVPGGPSHWHFDGVRAYLEHVVGFFPQLEADAVACLTDISDGRFEHLHQ